MLCFTGVGAVWLPPCKTIQGGIDVGLIISMEQSYENTNSNRRGVFTQF